MGISSFLHGPGGALVGNFLAGEFDAYRARELDRRARESDAIGLEAIIDTVVGGEPILAQQFVPRSFSPEIIPETEVPVMEEPLDTPWLESPQTIGATYAHRQILPPSMTRLSERAVHYQAEAARRAADLARQRDSETAGDVSAAESLVKNLSEVGLAESNTVRAIDGATPYADPSDEWIGEQGDADGAERDEDLGKTFVFDEYGKLYKNDMLMRIAGELKKNPSLSRNPTYNQFIKDVVYNRMPTHEYKAPIVVGNNLVNPYTGKLMFTGRSEPYTDIGKLYRDLEAGLPRHEFDFEHARLRAKELGMVTDGKQQFDMEQKLKGDFLKAVEKFTGIHDAFRLVELAYKGAQQGHTAAADMSMIFAYMKLLDPTSVVREGEQATAREAGSVPDQLVAAYKKAIEGDGLSQNMRNQFYAQAKLYYEETYAQYEGIKDRMKEDIEKWKHVAPRLSEASILADTRNEFVTGAMTAKRRAELWGRSSSAPNNRKAIDSTQFSELLE